MDTSTQQQPEVTPTAAEDAAYGQKRVMVRFPLALYESVERTMHRENRTKVAGMVRDLVARGLGHTSQLRDPRGLEIEIAEPQLPPLSEDAVEEIKKLRVDLNRFGTNLNQLMRVINAKKLAGAEVESAELTQAAGAAQDVEEVLVQLLTVLGGQRRA